MPVASRCESERNRPLIGPRAGSPESCVELSTPGSTSRRLAAHHQNAEHEANAGRNADGLPRVTADVLIGFAGQHARVLQRLIFDACEALLGLPDRFLGARADFLDFV